MKSSKKNKKPIKKASCKDRLEVVLKEVENLTLEAKDFFADIKLEDKKDASK